LGGKGICRHQGFHAWRVVGDGSVFRKQSTRERSFSPLGLNHARIPAIYFKAESASM
jgi:hypothetical protein